MELNTRKMALSSLFAALICLCAWIAIPMGDVSITMQTFGVFLSLGLLGGKYGFVTVLVYLTLGAAGLPVFSGFQGGFGVLLGPAGGYIWGFLVGALAFWCIKKKLAGLIAALACCYICGTLWYYFAFAAGTALWPVLLKCVVPFLLPDGIKLSVAYVLIRKLEKHLP